MNILCQHLLGGNEKNHGIPAWLVDHRIHNRVHDLPSVN